MYHFKSETQHFVIMEKKIGKSRKRGGIRRRHPSCSLHPRNVIIRPWTSLIYDEIYISLKTSRSNRDVHIRTHLPFNVSTVWSLNASPRVPSGNHGGISGVEPSLSVPFWIRPTYSVTDVLFNLLSNK